MAKAQTHSSRIKALELAEMRMKAQARLDKAKASLERARTPDARIKAELEVAHAERDLAHVASLERKRAKARAASRRRRSSGGALGVPGLDNALTALGNIFK